jgi:hypothetical protein
MSKFFPAVLILAMAVFAAYGQEPDSVSVALDSIYSLSEEVQFRADTLYADSLLTDSLKNEFDLTHSPMKATLYSLVLPGLGQAYNKKYWKIPIVWAALGGVGYAINFNTQQYQQAVIDYQEDPSQNNEFKLRGWRRYVELSYIGLVVVYTLQVLDAYVDAQLYNWNVNDNLSLGVSPSLQPMLHPSSFTGQAVGLTCSLKIRGR